MPKKLLFVQKAQYNYEFWSKNENEQSLLLKNPAHF